MAAASPGVASTNESTRITAGILAGAVVTILLNIPPLNAWGVPKEVAAALTTIFTFILSFLLD